MRLSRLAYYIDFFLSAALVACLAGYAASPATSIQILQWLLTVCLGAIVWTVIEYGVHRVIYHHAPYFRDLHDAHHARPNAYIGAPPLIGIIIIIAVFFAPVVTVSAVAATGLTAGVLLGYMAYMLIHHAAHHWVLTPQSWLYRTRRHHSLHHHNSTRGNFGITTSFWDHAFGTAIETHRPSRSATRLPRYK